MRKIAERCAAYMPSMREEGVYVRLELDEVSAEKSCSTDTQPAEYFVSLRVGVHCPDRRPQVATKYAA